VSPGEKAKPVPMDFAVETKSQTIAVVDFAGNHRFGFTERQ
jgi:hypothetical protein